MSMPEVIDSSADISDCGKYRYDLWRRWGSKPYLMVIGLNPSTADASKDDPTIRRCIRFAQDWGYGGLCMVNLFAYRVTDRTKLRTIADPVGSRNTLTIMGHAEKAGMVLAAWGGEGGFMTRDDVVLFLLRGIKPVYCLGKTKEGKPRHPLYIKASTEPVLL